MAWFRNSRTARPGHDGLDGKLAQYLDFRGGFFIEAGANDGYSQSNTYFLEKKRGWRGLLVEGIPELYEKCRQERKHSSVVHCALVAPEYPQRTVTMHYANLMSVVSGSLKTAQAEHDHLAAGIAVQKLGGSYAIEVPARTLASVLDDLALSHAIDFLSLDVEGLELDVLKGLDLARYRPRFILVEARFYDEVNTLLAANRYRQVEQLSHHDYLYRTE